MTANHSSLGPDNTLLFDSEHLLSHTGTDNEFSLSTEHHHAFDTQGQQERQIVTDYDNITPSKFCTEQFSFSSLTKNHHANSTSATHTTCAQYPNKADPASTTNTSIASNLFDDDSPTFSASDSSPYNSCNDYKTSSPTEISTNDETLTIPATFHETVIFDYHDNPSNNAPLFTLATGEDILDTLDTFNLPPEPTKPFLFSSQDPSDNLLSAKTTLQVNFSASISSPALSSPIANESNRFPLHAYYTTIAHQLSLSSSFKLYRHSTSTYYTTIANITFHKGVPPEALYVNYVKQMTSLYSRYGPDKIHNHTVNVVLLSTIA